MTHNVSTGNEDVVTAEALEPASIWLLPKDEVVAIVRGSPALAEGVIRAANFVGPLTGQPLSALVEAMLAGNTYVNVHTNDFVAPPNTGPGDFPGGEMRGQIDGHDH